MQDLMSPMKNFKELRDLQSKSSPPKIPCLSNNIIHYHLLIFSALLFHDLVLSEDGNDDYCDEEHKFINLHKILVLGKIYSTIIETRKEHYPLTKVDLFDMYFKKIKETALTIDQINDLSYQVEKSFD